MAPLYPRILGERWPELPERLRRSFDVKTEMKTSGRFRVRCGERALSRWLARWGGFPRAGESVAVELTVTPDSGGETWKRRFGTDEMITRQWEECGLLTERAGALELGFRLSVSNGRMVFHQERARLSARGVRVSLPGWISPRVKAMVWEDGAMQVSVEVTFPGLGLLCSYEGSLEWMEAR
jgi:hypothetical protein